MVTHREITRTTSLRAHRLLLLLTLVALVAPTWPASAEQAASPPALAQDGRGLFNEPAETRAMFTAAWGDAGPGEWVQEHDAALSGGTAPSGPRIGLLYAGSASANPAFTQGLASGLRSVGYHPGQDITIIWRFADGHNELLPALAAELVALPVDLIVAPVVAESMAAKQATSTIPIVTMTVADPVGVGLVNSLEHPGTNVTGVIQQPLEFNTERLAFLKDAVPDATRIAVLANVATPDDPSLTRLREAAASLGLELQILTVVSADDLPGAFASAADQSADAMMVLAGTLFTANRSRIVQLAMEHRIPALYPSRLFVDAGGLMDYAFVEGLRGQRAAQYVSEILHGAKPADLPMEPPPETELVINLNAADAIGYAVPASVLTRATDVLH